MDWVLIMSSIISAILAGMGIGGRFDICFFNY